MISLSNVIKKTYTDEKEEKITIRLLTMNRSKQPHEETDGSIQSLQNNEHIEKAIEAANLIVERANQEADQIRRQIEKEKRLFAEEKEKMYQQAHHEGYSKGIQLGQEKGYREVEELIQFAKSIVDEAKIEYQKCIDKSEQTILTLSIKVAEKILCSSLNENEERFLPLVKKAIDEVKNYKEVQLYVNPRRYALLIKKKEELLPHFHDGQLYIYPDENLSETSCIIETDGLRIDVGLDTQLQEIKKKLYEMFIGDEE
jgi:flagellar assembly protein FliH